MRLTREDFDDKPAVEEKASAEMTVALERYHAPPLRSSKSIMTRGLSR